MRTGYVYHEIFGWHDTGTFVGDAPSDPGQELTSAQKELISHAAALVNELP